MLCHFRSSNLHSVISGVSNDQISGVDVNGKPARRLKVTKAVAGLNEGGDAAVIRAQN